MQCHPNGDVTLTLPPSQPLEQHVSDALDPFLLPELIHVVHLNVCVPQLFPFVRRDHQIVTRVVDDHHYYQAMAANRAGNVVYVAYNSENNETWLCKLVLDAARQQFRTECKLSLTHVQRGAPVGLVINNTDKEGNVYCNVRAWEGPNVILRMNANLIIQHRWTCGDRMSFFFGLSSYRNELCVLTQEYPEHAGPFRVIANFFNMETGDLVRSWPLLFDDGQLPQTISSYAVVGDELFQFGYNSLVGRSVVDGTHTRTIRLNTHHESRPGVLEMKWMFFVMASNLDDQIVYVSVWENDTVPQTFMIHAPDGRVLGAPIDEAFDSLVVLPSRHMLGLSRGKFIVLV